MNSNQKLSSTKHKQGCLSHQSNVHFFSFSKSLSSSRPLPVFLSSVSHFFPLNKNLDCISGTQIILGLRVTMLKKPQVSQIHCCSRFQVSKLRIRVDWPGSVYDILDLTLEPYPNLTFSFISILSIVEKKVNISTPDLSTNIGRKVYLNFQRDFGFESINPNHDGR